MIKRLHDSRRLRVALGVTVLAVAAAIYAYGSQGLGGESPAKAVYSIAHGVEHSDREIVCERIISKAALPAPVTRALTPSLDAGGAASAGSDESPCERLLQDAALAEALGLHEPKVTRVTPIPLRPSGGVTRASLVEVGVEGESMSSLTLVEHRGVWKLVVDGA